MSRSRKPVVGERRAAPSERDRLATAAPETEGRADKKERTRRKLLDSALMLVDERGFAALSLRELTKTVGIAPTAFYRHFSNLDELGMVLVEESFGALGVMLREARADRPPPELIVDASIDVLARHVEEHRSHFAFLARERDGGHLAIRTAIRNELRLFRSELAVDLARLPIVNEWTTEDLYLLADLIVQTVVYTTADLVETDPADEAAVAKVLALARKKLRMIIVAVPHWQST